MSRDEFVDKFDDKIISISSKAPHSAEMARTILEQSFKDQAPGIIQSLSSGGMIDGRELKYKECSKLDKFDLGIHESKRKGINSTCYEIAARMSLEVLDPAINKFGNAVGTMLFEQTKGIIRHDIMKPVINAAGSTIAGYGAEELFKTAFADAKYGKKPKRHTAEAKSIAEGAGAPTKKLMSESQTEIDTSSKKSSTSQTANELNNKAKQSVKTVPNDAEKFFGAVKELAKMAEVEKNQCLIPKQSYKHGWIGETADSTAAWIDSKINAVVDSFFEFSYELGKTVAQNDPLYENTITFPKYERGYSQGVRNVVNEGFEIVGMVTNEVLKSTYSSRPMDIFLDPFELREQIAQRREEYDQAMNYAAQKLYEHTTYGERRLVEIGLTLTGVGKVVHDTVRYGELFGHRHIVGGKFEGKIDTGDFNAKLKVGEYGKPFPESPYGGKEYVLLYQTNKPIKNDFIRLFDPVESKPNGAFIIRTDDFKDDVRYGVMRGWSESQTIDMMVDKYGLPIRPSKLVLPELPSEVLMGVGQAGPIKFLKPDGTIIERAGGGRQYQILQEPDKYWFPESNVHDLKNYIKQLKNEK